MQKTSPSPASALRRPRIVQTASPGLKKSPVVAIRRTSSGRDLHDQLRRSPSSASYPASPLPRPPHLQTSPSAVSPEEAFPRPPKVSFSPVLQKTAGVTPLVPDLSLIFNELSLDLHKSALRPILSNPFQFPVAPPILPQFPAPSYDAFLIQRIQQQDTEITNLRAQLQYYMHLHEQRTANSRALPQVCHTSSQTDPGTLSSPTDMATMTETELTLWGGLENSKPAVQTTHVSKAEIYIPLKNDKKLLPEVQETPSQPDSRDVSIACNNLAQKYLNLNIPCPAAKPSRPQLISTNNLGASFCAVSDGGVSVATQSYLERHRLIEPFVRTTGRLYRESIAESDEDQEALPYLPIRNSAELLRDEVFHGGASDGQFRAMKISPPQLLSTTPKHHPREASSPKSGNPQCVKSDDLVSENQLNLPKLLPKKFLLPSVS